MNEVGLRVAPPRRATHRTEGARQAAMQAVFPLVSLLSLLAFVALVLTGCAVGPAYRPPVPTLPSTWQAALPTTPDTPAPADWWGSFDDPAVAALVGWADRNSPTLDKALAQIAIARATLESSAAALRPSVDGSASVQRGRSLGATGVPATQTTRSAALDASWELDLFGKLRQTRNAASARVEARSADWAAARVSLAAEVADDYAQYRSCRLLEAGYAQQAASLEETVRVTTDSSRAGFTAPADVDLAVASAATARSTQVQQHTACEVLVKALVALTGSPETALRQTIDARRDGGLPMPATFAVSRVPADLLRQRPDIAAAERTLAAANADIGQAEANRYPSLSLGGSIGISAIGGAAAVTTSALGPILSLPIFDGGTRRAAVASAQASFDAAFADYQGTLRTAVQEVEQALVQLYGATRRSQDAELAAMRYERYFDAAQIHWRAGGIDLLTLEEARRNWVTAQTTWVSVRLEQLRQYIALYKALGGGWQAAPMPASALPDTPAAIEMPDIAATPPPIPTERP